ncbi:MAG: MFS transporter, partial [Steroidobacteraceae bacterium]|nr:MFS transporter [Steroidobacteraceae bacterium]MDW8258656.1 MFS transporter [Gammaproteobacteria bacterium]
GIFNPPPLQGGALVAAQLGWSLLYATGYTCFNIPYLALAGEMSEQPHTRARLMGFRVLFLQLGIATGSVGALSLVTLGGGGRDGYGFMASVVAFVIALPMLIAVVATRGHDSLTTPPADRVATPLRQLLEHARGLTRNRPFVVLMGVKLLQMIGVAASSAAMLFLIKKVLGRSEAELALKFGVPSLAGTILFIPFWLAVARRYGKRNTWFAVCVLFVAVCASFLLATPAEPDWLFALRGLLFGVCTAGNLLMAQAMLTDTMHYDRLCFAQRREGLLSGIYSSVEKLAFAFAPLAVGVLLDISGFDKDAAVQSTGAARAIYFSAALLPALAFALSLPVLRAYRLDERQLQSTH